MKKIISVVTAIFLVLSCLAACTDVSQNRRTSSDGSVERAPVFSIYTDWPVYSTNELAVVSDNIFEGKVIDISFDIVDMVTGKSDMSYESESTHRMLYTIYTVEVNEMYKGGGEDIRKICVEGGIVGYNEEKQLEYLEKSGLSKQWPGIPMLASGRQLVNGETYLFCTHGPVGHYECIINIDQFAIPMNSNVACDVIGCVKKLDL